MLQYFSCRCHLSYLKFFFFSCICLIISYPLRKFKSDIYITDYKFTYVNHKRYIKFLDHRVLSAIRASLFFDNDDIPCLKKVHFASSINKKQIILRTCNKVNIIFFKKRKINYVNEMLTITLLFFECLIDSNSSRNFLFVSLI